MPSIQYFNQSAPFWDFIASLENAGGENRGNPMNHPFFAAMNPEAREQHRGPPPAEGSGAPPPPPQAEAPSVPDAPQIPQPPHSPHEHPFGPGFPFGGPHAHGHHHGGPHHRGGPGFRGRGRCGGGPPGLGGWGNFDMSKLGDFISQFAPDASSPRGSSNTNNDSKNTGNDFAPPADVFDTEDSYIIHISLPGAKKEDIGVNWDADKSELSVAGVIYRPGDEEFLKTLALDERKVGLFDRKVRLGSRVSPAQVEADEITAKMENGVLIVTIPKIDRDFVEIKKVDIE